MMQGSVAWNWRTDILCFHLLFYLSALCCSVTSWVKHWLSDTVIVFILFNILFFSIELEQLVEVTSFGDTRKLVRVWVNVPVCTTKVCPREWMKRGVCKGKNWMSAEEDTTERFTGSTCSGSVHQSKITSIWLFHGWLMGIKHRMHMFLDTFFCKLVKKMTHLGINAFICNFDNIVKTVFRILFWSTSDVLAIGNIWNNEIHTTSNHKSPTLTLIFLLSG